MTLENFYLGVQKIAHDANFFLPMGSPKVAHDSKKCIFFADFPLWANGPYSPTLGVGVRCRLLNCKQVQERTSTMLVEPCQNTCASVWNIHESFEVSRLSEEAAQHLCLSALLRSLHLTPTPKVGE